MSSNVLLPMLLKLLSLINLLSFISLFLFLFILCKWVLTSSPRHQNLPPSPPKLPILGHLHKLGTLPHRSLQALSMQFGEVMLIHLGSRPALVVSSARVAKEIMKTNDAIFSNRPKSSISYKLMYKGRDVAFAPYGEYWRQAKSIFVLKLLSSTRVRSFRVIREEETSLMIEQISKSTSAVNLRDLFSIFMNDVVCRVAFGRKYSGDQKGVVDFREFLKDFQELLGVFNVGDYIPWMGWINKFNCLDKRLDNTFQKFDMLIEKILEEHEDRLQTRDYSSDELSGDTKDFVDVLFDAQKDNKLGFPLERDSIKALIVDAFAAGTDTSSTVLEWVMSELLRNPRVMKELQEEVRGVTGDRDVVTEDDLEKMKYLKAVIKEALRLHPPVPLLVPRESIQDSKINGYDIPSGTMVIINAWAIQNNPLTWDEPEAFRPERFLNSAVDYKGQDFELIPFGSGRRICPGITFAATNNEIVLANLVHKFDWSLPDGAAGETLDMSENPSLTVCRLNPLYAIATPQNRNS